MKVFCNNCRYFTYGAHYKPFCKSNPDITWWGDKWTNPKEKNSNNDCEDFEHKTVLQKITDAIAP